jgi:hypothetical protein
MGVLAVRLGSREAAEAVGLALQVWSSRRWPAVAGWRFGGIRRAASETWHHRGSSHGPVRQKAAKGPRAVALSQRGQRRQLSFPQGRGQGTDAHVDIPAAILGVSADSATLAPLTCGYVFRARSARPRPSRTLVVARHSAGGLLSAVQRRQMARCCGFWADADRSSLRTWRGSRREGRQAIRTDRLVGLLRSSPPRRGLRR